MTNTKIPSFLDELTSDKCPITTQIESIDDSIRDLNFRICTLEGKLKFLHPESTDRKTIESELTEIKKLVETHQVGLKSLRQQNRKSFMFVAGLIFFIFFSYSIYVLVYGV